VSARGSDGARLALSSGTVLQLTPQARIEVRALGTVQRFRLPDGRLHADVAPLDVGQRFLIETPDGEIEVHGTVFELAVAPPQRGCSTGTSTRLLVSKGVVEVRSAGRDDYVRAGQHWPPECEALADLSAAAPREGTPAALGEAGGAVTAGAQKRTAQPASALKRARGDTGSDTPARTHPASPSELAAQNDLFAAAMAAKGRGQRTRALEDLDRLIARFPKGQLAEAAHAERMRVRRQAGDLTGARRGAREYLDSFPDGLAGAEARVLLGLTPGAR
jgi:hypothetical protein